MSNKDVLLVDQFDGGLNNMYSQMVAPFYALSNFFLNAVSLQTDVVKESESKNERLLYRIDPSKISPKVYSILEQKAQANEMEAYITALVEQELEKVEKEETLSLFDTLREEFLSEINLFKQEFASRPVVEVNGVGFDQANDLRDSLTKLNEQKLDKNEFQTLFNSFRSEILDRITLLKKELAVRSDVPVIPSNSNLAVEHLEKVNDLKEGQLLESNQVTGTIKEVIDVDF
jgi:hypothetical protein